MNYGRVRNKKPIVGILGGMGPAATNYLFQQIIKQTPVKKDQDHLHVIINSYSTIPDRTDAITGKGEDALPFLLEGLDILNKAGVSFILMPCNTAHYYLPELQRHTKAQFIDMLKLTVEYIKRNFPWVKKVGLLATEGTIKARIYEAYCESNKLELVIPDPKNQTEVTRIIYGRYGIKNGWLNNKLFLRLQVVLQILIDNGAEVIVLGCTELPLLVRCKIYKHLPVIDPMKLLAKQIVTTCTELSVSN